MYQRVYRNKTETAYVGWCPKCMSKVEVKIGTEGKPNRFFSAE